MIEELRAAVDELDIPVDGASIVAVLRARDLLDAKLADTLGRFDSSVSLSLGTRGRCEWAVQDLNL